MPRVQYVATTAMFSLLAISCAQSGQNEVASQEVIVTAQRRIDAGNAPKQDLKTYDVAEEAPAAPPPARAAIPSSSGRWR